MILVTGANGFIGRALCHALADTGHDVRAVVREESGLDAGRSDRHEAEWVAVGDIGPDTDWAPIMDGVDTIVHLAARAHILKETEQDPLAAFRSVNVEGTRRLAESAASHGTRRLVFVSSIGVNGSKTVQDRGQTRSGFSEGDIPKPSTPYAISKWEAEQALHGVAAETSLELVIVRPPLVYGPGVRANFLRLLRLVSLAVPLPFASVRNRRSFVGVENLVDFLIRCVEHPKAAGETFLISDGEDLSTPDLLRRLARHLGRPARLFPFPESVLRLAVRALGRGEVTGLVDSLVVNSQKARQVLDWSPVLGVDEGLARMCRWYLGSRPN